MRVYYHNHIDVKGNMKLKQISHYDIDNYNIERKGFIEFILNEPRRRNGGKTGPIIDKDLNIGDAINWIRLYFDIDSVTTVNEYKEVIQWLDSLTKVFGKYSIGGYTSIKDLSDCSTVTGAIGCPTGFAYNPNSEKPLSLHVVFHETKILKTDLKQIIEFNNGRFAKRICPFVDDNVYHFGGRQAFRHTLSNKVFKYGTTKMTIGKILNNDKPSTQVATIRGDERPVNESEWRPVFEGQYEFNDKTIADKRENQFGKHNSRYSLSLFMFNDDQFDKFINYFPPEFSILTTTFKPLWKSPYSKDFLVEHLTKWFKRNGYNTKIIENYARVEYKYTLTNEWFFEVIKSMDKISSDCYRQYYFNVTRSKNTCESIKQQLLEQCQQNTCDVVIDKHIKTNVNDLVVDELINNDNSFQPIINEPIVDENKQVKPKVKKSKTKQQPQSIYEYIISFYNSLFEQ